MNARRESAWPRKATKPVTNESSMSLAKIVVRSIASAGFNTASGPEYTLRPQKGSLMEIPRNIPEKTQEKTQIMMILMFNHVKRDW
jgi:hypothetical protein